MRVLFFNEGNLGSHVMGQGQLETALRGGLAGAPDVEARFAGLAPMGRLSRSVAVRTFGPLQGAGLEFRALRWHAVQAARAARAMRRELHVWPADVVHVHSQTIAFAMGHEMRARPFALSLDTTAHDWWSMPSWRDYPGDAEFALAPSVALERRALRRAALVLAWTGWARRAVERSVPGANVVEHHPGIDLARYRPVARSERRRPRVLFVGGRFADKGGHDLLGALAELGDEVELDIVTPVPVPERPGVRLHRLGPDAPELLDLYQQADLFCLPTHGDAAPWAVLEAMACGTPVISTRIGGIPDLLDDGRAGVILEHGDTRALAGTLRALLGDEQERVRLGAAARARCEEHYDANRQAQCLLDLLRGLRAGG
jgi:glycosyltransferase involved in cell wall biosynthesis